MKYALVCAKDNPMPTPREGVGKHSTGLYQWAEIFDGDFLRFSELDKCALEYYDVVHVNMVTKHAHMVKQVRDILSWDTSTYLISNVDYAIEMIPNAWMFANYSLRDMIENLKYTDLVFCQESHQRDFIHHFLGADVPLIPHPVDTRYTKSFYRNKHDRLDDIALLYHLEEDTYIAYPSIVLDDKCRKGYTTTLFNYQRRRGRQYYARFDRVFQQMQFDDYLNELSRCKLALEYQTMHTHGRFVNDCACLGIPCVGSSHVESMERNFPWTMVDPFDFKLQRYCIEKLIGDPEFYGKLSEHAYDAVEHYNLKNSKKRMMEVLENVNI